MYENDDDDNYRDQKFLAGSDPGDENDNVYDEEADRPQSCTKGLHCGGCVCENSAFCCACGEPLD